MLETMDSVQKYVYKSNHDVCSSTGSVTLPLSDSDLDCAAHCMYIDLLPEFSGDPVNYEKCETN